MAEATRPGGSAAVKAARKKKIRQLEASLFGGGGSDVTTGLPELQRVGEYRDSIQCTLESLQKNNINFKVQINNDESCFSEI